MEYELYHHGILGMKWGVRRYQNSDGTLTDAGKKRYGSDSDGSNDSDTSSTSNKTISKKQVAAVALIAGAAALTVGAVAAAHTENGKIFIQAVKETMAEKMPNQTELSDWEKTLKDAASGTETDVSKIKEALNASTIMGKAKEAAKNIPEEKTYGKAIKDALGKIIPDKTGNSTVDAVTSTAKELLKNGAGAAAAVAGSALATAGAKAIGNKIESSKEAKATERINNASADDVKNFSTDELNKYNARQAAEQQYVSNKNKTSSKSSSSSSNYKEVLSNPENYSTEEIESALRRASALQRSSNYNQGKNV